MEQQTERHRLRLSVRRCPSLFHRRNFDQKMESSVQPLEKNMHSAFGAEVSAGAENPAFPDMSGSNALCGASNWRRNALEQGSAGIKPDAPGRVL